jgi:hypothetical protein
MSETRLIFLPTPELVYDNWPRIAPLFQVAVDEAVHGEFTLPQLLRLGLSEVSLFAFIEDDTEILMALAMEIRRYPNMAVLNVMAMAGQRMDELFAYHSPEIAELARSLGASHFEASGSKAMARMLKGCGWEFLYETVRYKL